jgi:hypothetical protein
MRSLVSALLLVITMASGQEPEGDVLGGVALGMPIPSGLVRTDGGSLQKETTIAGIRGVLNVYECKGRTLAVDFVAGAVAEPEGAEGTVLQYTADVRGAADQVFQVLREGHESLGWEVDKTFKKKELERMLEGMGVAERQGVRFRKGILPRTLVSYCKNYEPTSDNWAEAIAQMSTPVACFVRLTATTGFQCLEGL